MKNAAKALSITAVLLLLTATRAVVQQTLPDYTKWDKTFSANTLAVHNDKDVNLLEEAYLNNLDNLSYQAVTVFYDEQKRPWIAMYIKIIIYKNEIISVNFWLFEKNSNNDWSFVKDFSQSKDLGKETADFLKSRYNLEFK